ncbi:MAG: hypothetical protein E7Z66_01510 [Thermoplasmata archaeon]|nr:hypothetical protein [Thermoplasmata archaeon]
MGENNTRRERTSLVKWCYGCDLPIIENDSCPVCGNKTEWMDIGIRDIRPIFPYDHNVLCELLSERYGCDDFSLLNDSVGLICRDDSNRDNILYSYHGHVVAIVRELIDGSKTATLTTNGAYFLSSSIKIKFVICKKKAVPHITSGKNLMAMSVFECDEEIKKGDSVYVMTLNRRLVAVGIAEMNGKDMLSFDKGVAVKIKKIPDVSKEREFRKTDWDDVIDANKKLIKKKVTASKGFIKSMMKEFGDTATLSFSGGKDSLAALLLLIDAGYRVPIVYVNTGLEYDETVDYVRYIAEHYSLEIEEHSASTELFFQNFVKFGPPAVDYRWCCKTNKLPYVSRSASSTHNGRTLSFVGQRMYESENRKRNGRVWTNSWVPDNVCASPIQTWNSIHVWMYIFMKNAPYNVLYTKGMNRIGCIMCPASSFSSLITPVTSSKTYDRWIEAMEDYRVKHNLPKEWMKYGLWRWKSVPKGVINKVRRHNGSYPDIYGSYTRTDDESITMHIQDGYSPCVVGYSIEAAVSTKVDLDRLRNFTKIIGAETELDKDSQWIGVGSVTVYGEGSMISKAATLSDAEGELKRIFELIVRSHDCSGCSMCASRCVTGALDIIEHRVEINPDLCISCGECLTLCPSVKFG